MNIDDLAKVKGPVAGHNITEMETASVKDTELASIASYAEELSTAGLTGSNALETIKMITADVDHAERSAYLCDTTAGSITITVPTEVVDTFQVYDAERMFDINPCLVNIEGGGSFLLDTKNKSYTFFKSGGWYMNVVGRGRINGPE